jgi:phospholipid/cholesterol/gamma-HCH transport system permease protein
MSRPDLNVNQQNIESLKWWEKFFFNIGSAVLKNIKEIGAFSIFTYKFFYWLPRRPYRKSLFFKQCYAIGNKSLFIITLSGIFTGMVLAYQTYFGFKFISVDSLVGPVVALSMAKELAPVLAGLILSGKAGASMAAEIGSMKVSEQIDALEVMGIEPVQYLVVPRVLATTFTMPILMIFYLFAGNVASYVTGVKVLGIDEGMYFSKLSDFVFVEHILEGLIKATVFGFFIGLIGTSFGLNVKGGAESVGRATNLAVVWGMMITLILDYILTTILVQIL